MLKSNRNAARCVPYYFFFATRLLKKAQRWRNATLFFPPLWVFQARAFGIHRVLYTRKRDKTCTVAVPMRFTSAVSKSASPNPCEDSSALFSKGDGTPWGNARGCRFATIVNYIATTLRKKKRERVSSWCVFTLAFIVTCTLVVCAV